MFKQFLAASHRSGPFGPAVSKWTAARDCTRAIRAGRKAMSLATTQTEREASLEQEIARHAIVLRAREAAAREQGKTECALELAEAARMIDVERKASRVAQLQFRQALEALKKIIRRAEVEMRLLCEGQTQPGCQPSGPNSPGNCHSVRLQAESALLGLRLREIRLDRLEAALETLDLSGEPAEMIARLTAATRSEPVNRRFLPTF